MGLVVPTATVDARPCWLKCSHGCGRYVTHLRLVHLRLPGLPLDFAICPECEAKGRENRVFLAEVLLCRNG